MKKVFKKFIICIFCLFSFFNNQNLVYGATTEGNKMADLGASLACGEDRIYAQWSSTRIYNNITSNYINARDKYIVNAPNDDGSYASCDVSVATIVKASGVDPNFVAFLVPEQWRYLKGEGSKKWKYIGNYYKGNNTDMLEPGDVMVVNPDANNSGNDYMHIWMYLGNSAVRKYWPNSNADSIEGGYNSYENGSYYPTLFNAKENAHGDPRPYAIFRFNGTDAVKYIVQWANIAATQNIEFEPADPCDVISGELSTYISNLFLYICIGGIILVIILSSISLIKVVAGHDSEGLYNFFQSLKARIICLIVLLILPVIIPYLLNIINEVAPIIGFDSNNPLCK